jgi:hypothetical protein
MPYIPASLHTRNQFNTKAVPPHAVLPLYVRLPTVRSALLSRGFTEAAEGGGGGDDSDPNTSDGESDTSDESDSDSSDEGHSDANDDEGALERAFKWLLLLPLTEAGELREHQVGGDICMLAS